MNLSSRISLPESARVGEIIEVKTLVRHPMESGFRLDDRGQPVPRDILRTLVVTYLEQRVFEAEFGPGVAANPFVSFYLRATASGAVVFKWQDLQGRQHIEARDLNVIT